jgi:hypothetical protein
MGDHYSQSTPFILLHVEYFTDLLSVASMSTDIESTQYRLAIFPSPAGMSLTKLSLDGKDLIANLFLQFILSIFFLSLRCWTQDIYVNVKLKEIISSHNFRVALNLQRYQDEHIQNLLSCTFCLLKGLYSIKYNRCLEDPRRIHYDVTSSKFYMKISRNF